MKKWLFLFFFMGVMTNTFSQGKDLQVISSSGNTYESGNLSLDWTLGEICTDYQESSFSGISQGFHQPQYQVVKVKSIPVDYGSIEVYPNPASSDLFLNMVFSKNENGTIELLTTYGSQIWKNTFDGKEIKQHYSINDLPQGTYTLLISFSHEQYVQTFQIVKI